MIKFIGLIFFISLLSSSCSNFKLKTIIENKKNDLLAGESFLRYSTKRFELVQSRDNSIQRAVTFCHQGKISYGLSLLKKQIKKERNNPIYWNHIGTCHYLNDDLPKAKYFFNISISKGVKARTTLTSFSPALNNLGLVYMKLRAYDLALSSLKKADSEGTLLTPKFNMLQLYIKFAQLKKAKELSDFLYSKAPQDIDVISSRATIYLLKGKYKIAKKYYEKVNRKYLEREDISGQYAIVLFKLGFLEKAKKMLQNGQYTMIKPIKVMRDGLSIIIERKLELLKDSKYSEGILANKRS
ncbi:MAG: hypothetical protein HN576_13855 [Bacteriovoracaceae bacterium]|jgi:tetratricopeptide (TPR) repeat protein|nr:hypothetical protein [Bacteriovoracaceae bacterium]